MPLSFNIACWTCNRHISGHCCCQDIATAEKQIAMLEKVNEGNDRYIALTRERERRAQPRDEIDCEWLQLQLDQERDWRKQVEDELMALSIETALAWEQLEIEGISTQQMLREAIIDLKEKIRRESCKTMPNSSDENSSATNKQNS